MKRIALSFALLTGLAFILAQCGSADSATKTADAFFATLIKQDFDKAADMVELPVGDNSNLMMQLQQMENNPTNGQLKSFKKSIGFSTKISNGVKTVELNYTLAYDNGNVPFTVVIQNKGQGDKIISVQ